MLVHVLDRARDRPEHLLDRFQVEVLLKERHSEVPLSRLGVGGGGGGSGGVKCEGKRGGVTSADPPLHPPGLTGMTMPQVYSFSGLSRAAQLADQRLESASASTDLLKLP